MQCNVQYKYYFSVPSYFPSPSPPISHGKSAKLNSKKYKNHKTKGKFYQRPKVPLKPVLTGNISQYLSTISLNWKIKITLFPSSVYYIDESLLYFARQLILLPYHGIKDIISSEYFTVLVSLGTLYPGWFSPRTAPEPGASF